MTFRRSVLGIGTHGKLCGGAFEGYMRLRPPVACGYTWRRAFNGQEIQCSLPKDHVKHGHRGGYFVPLRIAGSVADTLYTEGRFYYFWDRTRWGRLHDEGWWPTWVAGVPFVRWVTHGGI